MTFVNWISIGMTVVILFGGLFLLWRYRKKLDDLDGFVGIVYSEKEAQEMNARADHKDIS